MGLQKEWLVQELENSEILLSHRPLAEEHNFYLAVKNGDMDFIRQNCLQGAFTNPEGMGILSKNPVTNIKYHFVVTVAMITRLCVEGGMEPEQAYHLSDFFILKMDTCKTISQISKLHDDMALNFTGKMLLQKNKAMSIYVTQCTEYIYSHLYERITIKDLAEFTALSPSYLSRLFKKELGISISDYIRGKKIERAENLVKYSEYSFIEIANYLAFSSQSHFIHTFEKLVGLTPKKYRDKYSRTFLAETKPPEN